MARGKPADQTETTHRRKGHRPRPVLDHGGGWFTAYAFLSRVTVKQGAKVAAGERIGLVGDTGQAKGSELHFEVRQGGKPVDPLDELPKAP